MDAWEDIGWVELELYRLKYTLIKVKLKLYNIFIIIFNSW
jgi:hypothetical protein